MNTAGVVLTVAGGLAELGGLYLTVRDIGDSRAQARELGLDKTVVPVNSGTVEVTAAHSGIERGGTKAPLEERIEHLEQRLAAVEQAGERRTRELGRRLHAEFEQAVYDARIKAREQDRELRSFLHTMLTGSLGRRRRGVVLFAAGVVLSVIGNVVG